MPLRLGLYPYLNMIPYHLPPGSEFQVVHGSPRAIAARAARRELDAAIVPIAALPEIMAGYEPLGPYGLATRYAAQSVLLFSHRPLDDLQGAHIFIPPDSRTSVRLLHVLLHLRYGIDVFTWSRDPASSTACLLIGDRALEQRRTAVFEYVYDLGIAWTEWQRLPLVFARWVVRRDLPPGVKTELGLFLGRQLESNLRYLPARVRSAAGAGPRDSVVRYLRRFLYRLGPTEEAAIDRFLELTATLACHPLPEPEVVGAVP